MTEPEIRPADPADAARLGGMTFPAYRHLLDLRPQSRHPELGDTERVQPLAFAAWHEGEPVGLAVAEIPLEGDQMPQLLSVLVVPEKRRQGIASRLVETVEEEMRGRGVEQLAAIYTTGRPAIGWMESLFTSRGWEPPEPGSLLVRFRPEKALASSAFAPRRVRAYGRGLEIFPWSGLGADEIDEMRRSDAEERWIEPALRPWQYPAASLDGSSVGARYRGAVVGWVLNHAVGSQLVRFSTSFMRRDLSRRGRILPLYQASLQRVVEQGENRVCSFITPFTYPNMIAFARRWIAPRALFVGESRRMRIRLRPPGD